MIKTAIFLDVINDLAFDGLQRNLFSCAAWVKTIAKTYRSKIYVTYVVRDSKVTSYMIYSVVKNFLEWKICMLSYSDYCDGCVNSLDDWKMIVASLRAEYPQYRLAFRNLCDPLLLQVPGLRILSKEKYHSLNLQPDLRQLWKNTHDSFKSAVKQSEKMGVIVRRCEKKELRKFYQLHLRIRKCKYKIFPQPYRFFENIWDEFIAQSRGVLLGAYDPEGNFIGGNIYLQCGDSFYYKFNTSRQSALQYRPNNLLFWEGIKYAKTLRCQSLDLGSSGLEQEGLIQFKNHTGAQMGEITHLGYEPPGYRFSQKRILRVMTKMMTFPIVPDPVVRWGSSLIYPYLA